MAYLRLKNNKKKECPQCAHASGIFVYYGELFKRRKTLIRDGSLIYGGPIKSDQAPDRFCTNCGHSWLDRKHL